MSRIRTNYPSVALYTSEGISSTAATKHYQLPRIQSFDTNVEISRTPLRQFGQTAAITKIVTEEPTVGASFSYYLKDGAEERALGFYVQDAGTFTGEANFISGQIASNSGSNFYVPVSPEGTDFNFLAGGTAALSGLPVYALGNCFPSSYEVNVAVGDIPTVTVNLEASSMVQSIYTVSGATTGCINPAVNPADGTMLSSAFAVKLPQPTPGTGASIPMALRPSQATLSFGTLTGTASGIAAPPVNLDVAGGNGIRVQSASISVPLSRSPIQQLGSRFAYARPTDLPITVTMQVEAIVNERVSRNLSAFMDDESTHDVSLTLKNANGSDNMKFTLKGAQIDSFSENLSLGDNMSVSLTLSADVGGILDQSRGLFVSGSNQLAIYS